LEYRSSHRSWVFDTDDFIKLQDGKEINGPVAQQIISAIEREEADAAYQEYYLAHEAEASKADLKKPSKPAAKAKASVKAGKTAKAKTVKPAAKAAKKSARSGK
ncbi:MAG: hypothetical protein WC881_00990, partial [Elusimicrobiota bacterium]